MKSELGRVFYPTSPAPTVMNRAPRKQRHWQNTVISRNFHKVPLSEGGNHTHTKRMAGTMLGAYPIISPGPTDAGLPIQIVYAVNMVGSGSHMFNREAKHTVHLPPPFPAFPLRRSNRDVCKSPPFRNNAAT